MALPPVAIALLQMSLVSARVAVRVEGVKRLVKEREEDAHMHAYAHAYVYVLRLRVHLLLSGEALAVLQTQGAHL